MIQITANTVIYRPIAQVFDFISAPGNDFQWQYGTLVSTPYSKDEPCVGAQFQSLGNFMGHRITSTFEVIEYEPNNKYVYKSLSGPLHSITAFAFEIDKGCTQVKLTMQATVVNMINLNESIIEKKMKKQFKENLTLLKNIMEGR